MKKEEIFYKKGYRVTEKGDVVGKKVNYLSLNINTNGYYRISCRYNGKKIYCNIHRLQAYQKYGKILFVKGVEVRHKNGNPLDNSYDNILIGTHSQNMMDVPDHIRIARAFYASSFLKKYNNEKIIVFYNKTKSYKKTMDEFNITSKGTLHYILNGRNKK